jgi:membrane-associated phospholipid phosphatase
MHGWFFKSTGTAAFLVAFFQAYFYLLRSPSFSVTIMPLTGIDNLVSFWPQAFYVYASLWFYTALVPALQPSFRALVTYGFGIGTVCLSGLVLFYLFPTSVPFNPMDLPIDPALDILRKIDLSGNACPSLHVATAIFSAICLHNLCLAMKTPKWVLISNWIWCACIVYSTMAIKQHVFLDVVAGAALGVIFGIIYPYFEKRFASERFG